MNSMFRADFFGQARLGSYSAPMRLGQDTPDESDTTGLTSGIEGFLKQLPPELLGTYNTKYQKCMTQLNSGGLIGIGLGGKCLVDLFKELRELFKNGPPKPTVLVPPASGEFPYLPVTVGVLGLAVLVWGLTKL